MIRNLILALGLLICMPISALLWSWQTLDYPGRIEVIYDQTFLWAFVLVPGLVFLSLPLLTAYLIGGWASQRPLTDGSQSSVMPVSVIIVPVIVVGLVSLAIAITSPLSSVRACFLTHREDFDEFRQTAPPATEFWCVDTPCKIGPYTVEAIGADVQGGVYIRTASHPDGFLDTMSYGFAYHPGGKPSPFGKSKFELTHLSGGWYTFSASDRGGWDTFSASDD